MLIDRHILLFCVMKELSTWSDHFGLICFFFFWCFFFSRENAERLNQCQLGHFHYKLSSVISFQISGVFILYIPMFPFCSNMSVLSVSSLFYCLWLSWIVQITLTHTYFCLIPGGGARELICFTQNTPLYINFNSLPGHFTYYVLCFEMGILLVAALVWICHIEAWHDEQWLYLW